MHKICFIDFGHSQVSTDSSHCAQDIWLLEELLHYLLDPKILKQLQDEDQQREI